MDNIDKELQHLHIPSEQESLEKIANYLEKIYEYLSSSERVSEKTKRNTEKE